MSHQTTGGMRFAAGIVKANVSSALITIVSLNASGGASLTLKTLKQLQQSYLKSMPTGLVSAAIWLVRGRLNSIQSVSPQKLPAYSACPVSLSRANSFGDVNT